MFIHLLSAAGQGRVMNGFSFRRFLAVLRKEMDPGPARSVHAAHDHRACR